MNAAQQIHAALGYADPKFPKPSHRYATPERAMRKGEDGMRKPSGYSKGLRNWCNGIAQRKHAANLAKRFTNA